MPKEDLYGDHIIFRAGKPSPSNLVPRPVDKGFLSLRDSLSNPISCWARPVFQYAEPYMHIDTSKLPIQCVIRDNDPPSHVSVINVTADELREAVIHKGNGKTIAEAE